MVNKIIRRLKGAYGAPKPLRKTDPVDEIIRTVLSQNTSDKNSIPAYNALKARFGRWEDALAADTRTIRTLIRHAGLANIKAKRIKEVLSEIREREGKISLSGLRVLDVKSARDYLVSLGGVGPKTAACVLLFSFAKPIMPVDTHIFRVAKRLGLLKGDATIDQAHEELTGMVPARAIYECHLLLIEHGRRTCKASRPLCGACVLYGLCAFKMKRYFKEQRDTKSNG
jgi:endonuclease-3